MFLFKHITLLCIYSLNTLLLLEFEVFEGRTLPYSPLYFLAPQNTLELAMEGEYLSEKVESQEPWGLLWEEEISTAATARG